MEFHAETSELIQMLRKGHYGVKMDEEAWERLITWIDLNAPCHGTWSDVHPIPGNQRERRRTLRELYGGVVMDAEQVPPLPREPVETIVPEPTPTPPPAPEIDGWPFDATAAKARQNEAGPQTRVIDLGDGVSMEFVRIPAGRFVMGDTSGECDEWPAAVVEIEEPFWMSCREVTNEQFAQFDPSQDSRFEHRTSWIFSETYLGWRLNYPQQPAVRVSWEKAMAFAEWLSGRSGAHANLPSEAQWEYACRAGTDSPLAFGDLETDFSGFANVADRNLRRLADEGWRPAAPDLVVRDDRFDDGALVTAPVGSYAPNAWGLYDMHGNAAEWTRTAYRAYPYRETDGRNRGGVYEKRVVRGGSWRDRPARCRSAFRLAYAPHQRVYNVGFRVILEE
jgi:formylglycine-generating enzyme required for sulfatase activity